ncbi:MAG: LysM peptidoglycan-binding domain-containing protein [Pseudomonadota bacterium]
MSRSMIIMAIFAVVTASLIVLQPARTPAPLPPLPETARRAETAPAVPEAAPTLSAAIRPKLRPQPIIRALDPAAPPDRPEVVPAVTEEPGETDGSGTEDVAPRGDVVLFAALAAERPTLLTLTARGPDGRLRPAPLALDPGDWGVASRAAGTPLDLAAASPLSGPETRRARLRQAPTRAVHRVRAGETLQAISRRYYGAPNRAGTIAEANRRIVGETGLVSAGQVLRIPDLDGL